MILPTLLPGKDVVRTDREEAFFAGDDNPNLTRLQNMLRAYLSLDEELGKKEPQADRSRSPIDFASFSFHPSLYLGTVRSFT